MLGLTGSVPATQLLTVSVSSGQLGSEQLLVSGTAPAYALVKLEMSAIISRDLPTIPVGLRTATADQSGKYSAIMAVAPAIVRGVRVTVRASINGGLVQASAATTYDKPNDGTTVPGWDGTSSHSQLPKRT
ncbi:MAG: hypothetical protein M3N13_02420 [Candidatus Eremiobacteraeota bacterium]|nr:hypothetical protein [Candidatus Eremiobacteraeota bacterium]